MIAALALAGCGEDGFQFPLPGGGGTAGEDAAGAPQTTELVERDVEAPEVFQVTEPGLWDGRPSLGGVWVAHPDVAEPERVIIRNTENGSFVIGALFRREREAPGPALQVSSDAAAALGMLAGDPAELNVTALRREEAAAEESGAATAPDADAGPAAPEDGESLAAPEAIAATTLPPAEGEAAPAPSPQPAPAPAPAQAQASAPASGLDRPYIQVGIFSVESNARGTAEQMEGAGLSSRVVRQESQGREFWRVLVGPAQSAAERSRNLDRVKGLGFTDAYAVRA